MGVHPLLPVAGQFKRDPHDSLNLFFGVSEGIDRPPSTRVLPAALWLTEVETAYKFPDHDEIDIDESLGSQR